MLVKLGHDQVDEFCCALDRFGHGADLRCGLIFALSGLVEHHHKFEQKQIDVGITRL
jgi:hypothetical protein